MRSSPLTKSASAGSGAGSLATAGSAAGSLGVNGDMYATGQVFDLNNIAGAVKIK